jgi:hypothetical protein
LPSICGVAAGEEVPGVSEDAHAVSEKRKHPDREE